MKSFKDISLDITEEEYRADPALSYSLLAKYERGGFNSIPTLFDKVESPSLTLGSAVDSIITGGTEEFESRFFIADFPEISDTIVSIIKWLFDKYTTANMSTFGSRVMGFRFFNVFGWGEFHKGKNANIVYRFYRFLKDYHVFPCRKIGVCFTPCF